MDDLDVLARDFGYRPQGKSAPMRSDATGDRRSSTVRSSTSSSPPLFNDVFGGPPKFTNPRNNNNFNNDFDYDSIFKNNNNSSSKKKNNNNNNNNDNNNSNGKKSSLPVYDKPVYDDDIFEGLPGLKSKSVSSSATNMKFEENVFASMVSWSPKQNRRVNDQFDDLLGSLGRNEKGAKDGKNTRSSSARGFVDLLGNLGRNEKVPEPKSSGRSSSLQGFDDLFGGFGSSSPASGSRTTPESQRPPKSTSAIDDPFVVLESTSTPASSSSGVFTDPLEEISNLGKSGSSKANASSVSGGDFDDLDPLNGFGKSIPPFSPEKDGRDKDGNPSRMGPSISGTPTSSSREHSERSSFRYSEIPSQKKVPVDNFQESPLFDMPSVSTDSKNSFSQNVSSPQYASASFDKNFQADMSPKSEQAKSDDIWLSVSEVPLFTQPTKAPPPSRSPPPIPRQTSKAESGLFSAKDRKKGDEYSLSYSSYSESPKPGRPVGRNSPVSQVDELDDFVTGRTQNSVENANVHSSKDMGAAAAAMKEAMDRAEAKFRHAKEVREREYAKAARSKKSVQMEKDEHVDTREREFRENEVRLEPERRQREKEEEEREQRRLERERERARQAEIERERARQAVERATREARERAVAEARERAAAEARERAAAEARSRAERATVEKAQAEARVRAERAAVQRAQAEARGRAAVEARERAEKAAAEARERVNGEARAKEAHEKAEARRRAERVAVEKAAAEVRERAAAEARERAAAAASRMNQQKNEPDLEDFFSTRVTRPNSAPKARASSSDPVFDSQFQTKGGPDLAKRTSSTSVPSSNMRKASSTTNIVDDLSSIFGAPPSSGEFQEVEGESEERRRARLERHQRTQERAAKALAEKNQRDLQALREQEERNRIAETLDFEIKRWAAGKEGNLRALLSTLQYVLWPECGWQPVSLTDLITGASVKKVYRKATLCIHPDKVQQKGATLQQKYIAEKVFDLLKESWNKFNSEELF